MLRLSAFTILGMLCLGCSHHIDQYKSLRNVDIRIGGELDHQRAESDAQSFEDKVNKQFDSNIKLPRLPFRIGRYVDSLAECGGIKIISIDGEF